VTTFGERLRALRLAAGMTQQALADSAGLAVSAVRVYEQGGRKRGEPTWASAIKLADALGVSLDRLAGREPPAGEPPKAPKRRRGR
jgi:transcriptional regulator with XRE-family HTH domain